MEIDFHDNYIFAVLVFMVFVWFARNCLDCLQALFNCLDRCDLSCCCGVQCIGYNAQYCLMMGAKRSLAIFCFMQPVLLCIVVMINNAKQDEDMQSSILLCRATLNSTLLSYKHAPSDHNATILQLNPERSGCTEVDFVMLAMPFAAAVSISTLSWVKLSNSGSIYGDTQWDESLYDSDNLNVFFYDLVYYFELLCMNICFVLGSSSEQSFLPLYFTIQSLTIAMLFFIVSVRFAHDTVVEQWIGMVFTAFIVSVMLPHWNESVQSQCSVSMALAMVHAFCVFLLVTGHYIPMGRATASYVLSLRLLVTVVACITIMSVLLVGRNRNC